MAHPSTGCHSDSGVCASKVPVCTVHLDTVQDCKCGPGFKGEGLACTGGLALAHRLHCYYCSVVYYTDIDECVLGDHNCSQLCQNTDGGFTCSCSSGFQLSDDGVSCDGVDLPFK